MSKLIPTIGFVKPGELFVCNCGIPLARKSLSNQYELIKFYDGKQVKIKIEFGDMLTVRCFTCGRGFAHMVVGEHLLVEDSTTVIASPHPL